MKMKGGAGSTTPSFQRMLFLIAIKAIEDFLVEEVRNFSINGSHLPSGKSQLAKNFCRKDLALIDLFILKKKEMQVFKLLYGFEEKKLQFVHSKYFGLKFKQKKHILSPELCALKIFNHKHF